MKNKKDFKTNFWRFSSICRWFLGILLVIGGIIIASNQAFAWSEPTEGPPAGNIAAPLNVSSSTQTKLGELILGGDSHNPGILRLYPGSQPSQPGSCDPGQLYYDKTADSIYYCNNNNDWIELGAGGGNVFKLFNETQTGWAYLKSDGAKNYAIKGVGAAHDNWSAGIIGIGAGSSGWSAGIMGQASEDSTTPYKYGVYGFASSATDSYGIYGWDFANASAYAGYFKGNVKIEPGAGGTSSLTLADNVNLVTKEICLNGDCRSSWPAGGSSDSYWYQTATDTYLTNTSSNLALGGTSEESAVFYVKVSNGGSVVIGQPTTSSYSCGDGICQSGVGEDNNTCSQDCPPDFSSEPTATNIEIDQATISWAADESHYARIDYDTDISDGEYSYSVSPDGQPKSSYSYDLTGLAAETTYHYRVAVWDDYGNYNYSIDDTFTTNAGPICDNGFCEAGETCASCPDDCYGEQGPSVGCGEGLYCCRDGNCYSCCSDLVGNCTGGTHCCSDHQCHTCCDNDDCIDRYGEQYRCCSDHTCQIDCSKNGGPIPGQQ